MRRCRPVCNLVRQWKSAWLTLGSRFLWFAVRLSAFHLFLFLPFGWLLHRPWFATLHGSTGTLTLALLPVHLLPPT